MQCRASELKGDFEEMGDLSPLFRCASLLAFLTCDQHRLMWFTYTEQIHDLTAFVEGFIIDIQFF